MVYFVLFSTVKSLSFFEACFVSEFLVYLNLLAFIYSFSNTNTVLIVSFHYAIEYQSIQQKKSTYSLSLQKS